MTESADIDITGPMPAGADIEISGASTAALRFRLPQVPINTTLIIFIVRDGNVFPSDPARWQLISSTGGTANGATQIVDLFVAAADAEIAAGGYEVVFASMAPQELTGGMIGMTRVLPNARAIEVVDHLAYTAELNPAAPGTLSGDADNTILCLWASLSAVAATPPGVMTLVDTYSSAVVATRDLTAAFVSSLDIGPIGQIEPGNATAPTPVSGRAFSIVIHFHQSPPDDISPRAAATPKGALGSLDQYIDPVSKDYLETETGEFLETADNRSMVLCQLEIELDGDHYTPEDGTRIKEMLRSGTPIDEQIAVADTIRALQLLAADGDIADVRVRATRDNYGRLTLNCSWRDLATGTPESLVYRPRGVS